MKLVTVQTPQHIGGMQDVDIPSILSLAARLKAKPHGALLQGKAILMLFEKASTRTRVSLEVGIQRLGGIPVSLDGQTSQLGRGESIEDTAKVLSRYGDALVYRARDHEAFEEMAKHADIPVINALTDQEHPLQVLADLLTLQETWGSLAGHRLAYVGDGNNMCHSYLLGAAACAMDIHVASPPGYGPDPAIVAQAERLAVRSGSHVRVGHVPCRAVRGADVVATDTWASMGDEAQTEARLAAFRGYTVDAALMQQATPGARFLHCLPGHWGQEATHDVAHGPASLIYDQAENRMWVQMAVLVRLLCHQPPR